MQQLRNEYAQMVRDYAAERNGVTTAMLDAKYLEIIALRKTTN